MATAQVDERKDVDLEVWTFSVHLHRRYQVECVNYNRERKLDAETEVINRSCINLCNYHGQ